MCSIDLGTRWATFPCRGHRDGGTLGQLLPGLLGSPLSPLATVVLSGQILHFSRETKNLDFVM